MKIHRQLLLFSRNVLGNPKEFEGDLPENVPHRISNVLFCKVLLIELLKGKSNGEETSSNISTYFWS